MTQPFHKEQLQKLNEDTDPITAIEGKLPDRVRGKNGQEMLKETLACLRAMSWLLQTLHWQTKGPNSYSLHLLFERLYEKIESEIDSLAEKLIGYFGSEAVERIDSFNRTQKWLRDWSESNEITVAIDAEKQLQMLVRQTYDVLKAKKEITLGLDDFLMNLANSHETDLYLLNQAK